MSRGLDSRVRNKSYSQTFLILRIRFSYALSFSTLNFTRDAVCLTAALKITRSPQRPEHKKLSLSGLDSSLAGNMPGPTRKIPYWRCSSIEIQVASLIGCFSVSNFRAQFKTNKRGYTDHCKSTSSVWVRSLASQVDDGTATRRFILGSAIVVHVRYKFLFLYFFAVLSKASTWNASSA